MKYFTAAGLRTFSPTDNAKLFDTVTFPNTTALESSRKEVEKVDQSWMDEVCVDLSELWSVADDANDIFDSVTAHATRYQNSYDEFIGLKLRVPTGLVDKKFTINQFQGGGWFFLDDKGSATKVNKLPEFVFGYFDSETFVKCNQLPLFGQLLIPQGVYFWVQPAIYGKEEEKFIPINQRCVLTAHNSRFDSTKVSGTSKGLVRWMDTLSWRLATKDSDIKRSLDVIYREASGLILPKSDRDVFKNMESYADLREVWNESVTYSLKDLNPLAVITEYLWLQFLAHRESAIAIEAHSHITSQVIPVNPSVIADARDNYKKNLNLFRHQILSILDKQVALTLRYGKTVFTARLDWSLVSETGAGSKKYADYVGKPRWYAEYCSNIRVKFLHETPTLSPKIAAHLYLYENTSKLPLFGNEENRFEAGTTLLELRKSSKTFYESGTVTSALGKEQNKLGFIRSLALNDTELEQCKAWMEFSRQISWLEQLMNSPTTTVEGLTQMGAGTRAISTLTGRTGANLPTLIKSSADARLMFSETRNRISTTEDYRLVFADFDSQESVLASLLGVADLRDGNPTYLGSTGYDRACLMGTKSLWTDYHSTVAKLAGLPFETKDEKNTSRKSAKVINLGTNFGMGKKKLTSSLMANVPEKFNDFKSTEQFVEKMMILKNGTSNGGFYSGGLESEYKNNIDIWVHSEAEKLREPFLGTHPPIDHCSAEQTNKWTGKKERKFFKLQNFYCQGGASQLLSIFISIFNELAQRFELGYNDAHICMTVHDEVVAVSKTKYAKLVARIMQYTHLLTWVWALRALNIPEICIGGAWFESVQIDRYWRKWSGDMCRTDSNPDGFPTDCAEEYTMDELVLCK